MPTVQVSTWDQFVAAFVGGTSSGDRQVIEIMADLDAKSSITGTIGNFETRFITINGNYHKISNIATAQAVNSYLFRCSNILWSKCNFVNMIRNEPYPVFWQESTSPNYFEDCTFQGQGIAICGTSRMDTGNYSGLGNFTRCFITWTQKGTTIPGTCFGGATFDHTYIDCELTSGAGSSPDFGSLQNTSYLKGKISGTPTGHNLLGSCSNAVINIESDSDYTITSNPGNVSVYNKDKLTGNIATTTNVIGVTDAELKDAAYLASIGFNIIV